MRQVQEGIGGSECGDLPATTARSPQRRGQSTQGLISRSIRSISNLVSRHPAFFGLQIQMGESNPRVKSRINLRDTWSKRQAGAMRPVRRAGWVRAASCAPAARSFAGWVYVRRRELELELELIQSHMAQKPVLRGEVGARALRVRSVWRISIPPLFYIYYKPRHKSRLRWTDALLQGPAVG